MHQHQHQHQHQHLPRLGFVQNLCQPRPDRVVSTSLRRRALCPTGRRRSTSAAGRSPGSGARGNTARTFESKTPAKPAAQERGSGWLHPMSLSRKRWSRANPSGVGGLNCGAAVAGAGRSRRSPRACCLRCAGGTATAAGWPSCSSTTCWTGMSGAPRHATPQPQPRLGWPPVCHH